MGDTPQTILLIVFLVIIVVFSFFYTYGLIHLFISGVPTISSNKSILEKLKSATVQKYLDGKKVFFELGCSYGRVLFFMCARYDLKGIGYETNLSPYLYSFLYKRLFYPKANARVAMRSFYDAQVENADVVFFYLMPKVMEKVEKTLVPKMKKNTVILANSFRFKNMEPSEILQGGRGKLDTLYIYRV